MRSPTAEKIVKAVYLAPEAAALDARKTYASYLSLSAQITHSSGENPIRLRAVVSSALYRAEADGFEHLAEKGNKSSGEPRITSFKLQAANLETGASSAYVCVDFSKVELLTKGGSALKKRGELGSATFQPKFRWEEDHLVLEANDLWSGKSIC